MREVGVIVWAVFIIIGVIANIASTARKQAAARAPQPLQPAQAKPQTVSQATVTVRPSSPVRRPQAAPAAPPAPAVPPAPAAPSAGLHEPGPRRARPFFVDAPSLVRAVIAAEVLGKPRALRDE